MPLIGGLGSDASPGSITKVRRSEYHAPLTSGAGAPRGSVVVCEVPLLFEAGMDCHFDLVITIEAGGEQRRRRSTHDFGLDTFSRFEALQVSSERRVDGSDLVFVNDGDVEHLRAFVRRAYERARLMAGVTP